jgi:hypothetical protein
MFDRRFALLAAAVLAQLLLTGTTCQAQTSDKKPSYSAMAPIDQYLIADTSAEIALARSAAPPSISDSAEVLVLGPTGYTSAAKGTNGFVCIVERSWAAATTEADFWNPKVRAPNCFNAAAARTFLPIFLLRTKLVLAGKSKAEILAATASALDKGEIPALEPSAMCYMLSKEQYLNDRGTNWRPHLMFFAPGGAAKTWGANLPGSPIMAADDPEERVTIFMVLAPQWSDGSPAPSMNP